MENLCLKGSEESASILGRRSECVFPHRLFRQGESQDSLTNVLLRTLTAKGGKFPNLRMFVARNLAFSNYLPIQLPSPSLELFEDSNCVLLTSAFPVFTPNTVWVS